MIEIKSKKVYQYIQEQINLSDKYAATSLKQVELNKGRVYALIAGNFKKDHLKLFNRSILETNQSDNRNSLVPIENTVKPKLSEIILTYLNSNSDHFCILEEPNARPGDDWIKNLNLNYKVLGEEIYYIFNKRFDKQFQEISNAITFADGYYFLCILSGKIHNEELDLSNQRISLSDLNKMLCNISSIIVKAYDGEGYLIWEKNR